MPRRILVTGSEGLIGTEVVNNLLDRGYEIKSSELRDQKACCGDVRDFGAMKRVYPWVGRVLAWVELEDGGKNDFRPVHLVSGIQTSLRGACVAGGVYLGSAVVANHPRERT